MLLLSKTRRYKVVKKEDEQICIYKFAHKMPICVYRQEINGTFYCFNNCKGCVLHSNVCKNEEED